VLDPSPLFATATSRKGLEVSDKGPKSLCRVSQLKFDEGDGIFTEGLDHSRKSLEKDYLPVHIDAKEVAVFWWL
jgi:hypothetical protein